jgi:hypothetical protein
MAYSYGLHPLAIDQLELSAWQEFMHFLYLPVVMPGQGDEIRLPPNLEFMRPIVERVIEHEGFVSMDDPRYVYVTARRGFATPGNPLNRPGWHADGFGSDDINFIWSDRWPTRFAVGDLSLPPEMEGDHVGSVDVWTKTIDEYRHMGGADSVQVYSGEPNTLYRLDPSVIHATPIIEPPGGMRSFFKISVSPDRYNLLGNSHNHLFSYDWKMWSREEVRNHPAYAGGDAGPQEVATQS